MTSKANEGNDPTPKTKKKDPMQSLNIGIDLGTSRSAMSASNSKKDWVESYVGWPKDFVAQKMLGKRVLFGDDALKNRLSLNLCRPLERGVIKDGSELSESAVKELVGCLIDVARTQDYEASDLRIIVGVPSESFKENKMAIKRLLSDFSDAIMVVSEPFSVAYGINELNNSMVIDIGAGTMDFCIMHGTMPSEEDQKTVLMAGDYIDSQLETYLSESYPEANFTINMVRHFKEQYSFVGDPPETVTVDIPVDGKPIKHNITEEMKRACESILPGLTETMLELIADFDPEFQKMVRNNIILAGGGSQIRGIKEHIEKVLKEYGPCKVHIIEDPLYAGADGALALAQDMPEEYWQSS
ncbi:MamK family actin-like protein [uncultured Desulfobacter sp.]|uniref:MamK family actin-like protein n=1 Tax=uncultured Desulfobacter sp. TaxID=240139 RepID=UPI0029F59908|nr:MamK family actin-like protein [uncultured Desulfobacter sp.]